MRYEYKTMTLSGQEVEGRLNAMARDGWRFVFAVQQENRYAPIFIFEREVNE